MSTKGLLEQSVMIAGESVTPIMGSLQDVVDEIKSVDESLLTQKEKSILEVAKALDDNLALINLRTAITAGGLNEQGFPNLAVATYEMSMDRELVQVFIDVAGFVRYGTTNPYNWRMRFPNGTFPPGIKSWGIFSNNTREATAPVPLVPLKLRQPNPEHLFLLFEVPIWDEILRVVDPYLLQHITGDVYAIRATWDITEKELNAYQAARKLGI